MTIAISIALVLVFAVLAIASVPLIEEDSTKIAIPLTLFVVAVVALVLVHELKNTGAAHTLIVFLFALATMAIVIFVAEKLVKRGKTTADTAKRPP